MTDCEETWIENRLPVIIYNSFNVKNRATVPCSQVQDYYLSRLDNRKPLALGIINVVLFLITVTPTEHFS